MTLSTYVCHIKTIKLIDVYRSPDIFRHAFYGVVRRVRHDILSKQNNDISGENDLRGFAIFSTRYLVIIVWPLSILNSILSVGHAGISICET